MTSAQADPNRKPNGQFAPGNKVAVGHDGSNAGAPSKEHIRRFNDAIRKGVSDADLAAIVRTAIEQAQEGDRFARRWLWDRVVGKPTQQIIQSRDADSELVQLLQSLGSSEE